MATDVIPTLAMPAEIQNGIEKVVAAKAELQQIRELIDQAQSARNAWDRIRYYRQNDAIMSTWMKYADVLQVIRSYQVRG